MEHPHPFKANNHLSDLRTGTARTFCNDSGFNETMISARTSTNFKNFSPCSLIRACLRGKVPLANET